MNQRESRVIAVLGMHRSGTSWMAGTLQERGLTLGDVNEEAPHNSKGSRENKSLQVLHKGVLADSRGTWRRPPRKIKWSKERLESLQRFVDEMNANSTLWGFKDPSTLLLLDQWHLTIPNIEHVGIFRHPEAVAASLAQRGFSPVKRRSALRLWNVYNSRLVAEHQRRSFPLLRFDVSRAELLVNVDRIATGLGLPDPALADQFFDDDLVHNQISDDSVPKSCMRHWEYLVANS